MPKEFSKAVCEKIGNYVYLLKDPRNGQYFYVGRGVGNRLFQHVQEAPTGKSSEKCDVITAIHENGEEVQYDILHGLNEDQAKLIEAAYILLLKLDGLDSLANLTNIVSGTSFAQYGLMGVEDVSKIYEVEKVTITEPAIILRINHQYWKGMSEDELYQATRKYWKVGDKADQAEYAISASGSIIREVYKIKKWSKSKKKGEEGRSMFEGEVAEQALRDKYIGQSIEKYKSSGNPINYTF